MLKIFVEEEYGYRSWVWHFPGNKQELVVEWKAKRRPVDFWGASDFGTYQGQVQQATREDVRRGFGKDHRQWFDARAHVHMEDDTYLEVDGVRYEDI